MLNKIKEKVKNFLNKDNIVEKTIFLNLFLFFSVIFSFNFVNQSLDANILNTLSIINFLILSSVGVISFLFLHHNHIVNETKKFLLKNDNDIKSFIIKKIIFDFYLPFYCKDYKELTDNIKKEIENYEPLLNKVENFNELKEYIKTKQVNINDLLTIIEKELPFMKYSFINNFKIKNNHSDTFKNNKVENKSFELLTDNTVISNEINELIKLYKFNELHQSKLDMNEKIELNKISNTLEKIIIIFNEVKELKNKEIEDNLILLINELKVSIKYLKQSIQNTIIKDIKVLSKTLKLEN